jgi:DNA-binding HxlR family transcriptional regulator
VTIFYEVKTEVAFARGRDRTRNRNEMPETYGLDCPVARALDIVGERWTVLILRDLFLQGPRRFQDLQTSLAGISPNTLSARLKRLEDAGIIEPRMYAEHPPRAEYVLTDKGRELGPVLKALRAWGERHTRR